MLPDFNENGYLDEGVWDCTGDEFLERFVVGESRTTYYKTTLNIIEYANYHGAISILVGGSFVSNQESPSDLDCVILFKHDRQIPQRIESLDIGGCSVDIFFASEDQHELKQSFLKLLTTSRYGTKTGVVDIRLIKDGSPLWDARWEPDDELYEIVKRAYIDRHFVDKMPRDKALVTIHGIRTHADWNAEVTLNASANGWMVAPFQYGYEDATVFLKKQRRKEIVDRFRDFLARLSNEYGIRSVSVLAHSFGTYIAVNYILGFDEPPTRFDSLILCGAIIDHDLDLDRFQGKAANIINEKAPNDEWVEWAKKANFGRDELFGYAGTRGFTNRTARLYEPESTIFTHNNVIKSDVMSQRWLPFLEANKGSVEVELWKMTRESLGLPADI